MKRLEGPVAGDAIPWVAGFALFALVFANFQWVPGVVFTLLAAGCVAAFFRNPDRNVPNGPGIVVAPADGRVIAVERMREEYFEFEDSIRVSIFMSVFNVHVNRMPISARMIDRRYHPGAFFVASRREASERNERLALLIEGQGGVRLVVVQIAGIVARRIVCLLTPGKSLERGERFGLIRFGSRLDVYLPADTKMGIKVGDRTRAGETVMGVMP